MKSSIEVTCEEVDPRSDIEHYVICPICGQILDCRDKRQVAHHSDALHEPLVN